MIKWLTPLLAMATLLAASVANAKSYPQELRKACRQDPHDRYDLGWSVPERSTSVYHGQCIDTSMKRPTILLGAGQEGIRFANFYYKGHYYTATAPADAVSKIYFHVVEFTKILGIIKPAHTQLRFFMKKGHPLHLVAQSGSRPDVDLQSFVFSADYMAPAGVPYDALKGMNEIYMNAQRFVSVYDRVQWQIVRNGNTVRQFELKINSHYANQVLWAAIDWADQRGMMDVYNTVTMNCTTEAFRMLFLGLELPMPAVTWQPDNLLDPVTGSSLRELTRMGLIDQNSERQTLNQEYGLPQKR